MIIKKLEKDGEVSRNWALKNYISRLSAWIYILRKRGWDFDTERRPYIDSRGKKRFDYVYIY